VTQELKAALIEFVRFAQTLRGDEKSEAQAFLDHFFRALGHEGVIEAGATFELRVAKKPGSPQLELIKGNGASARARGGKKFADLLWPDRVLIEMKSRGENLEKHYDQTFDYWTHIVPKRPPFVILCNFDEFWIYDFNTQLFDPVERVKLADLPKSISAFNFVLPIWKKPIFGNNWVEVTRRAADQMATEDESCLKKFFRRTSFERPVIDHDKNAAWYGIWDNRDGRYAYAGFFIKNGSPGLYAEVELRREKSRVLAKLEPDTKADYKEAIRLFKTTGTSKADKRWLWFAHRIQRHDTPDDYIRWFVDTFSELERVVG
jgi:MmeI, N-terminal domain